MRSSRVAIVVVAVALTAAATAAWLFPRAFPIVALKQSLTRDVALARADSFFRAHSLAPAGARTAVRFQGNDSLRTFVELAGGGHDSLNALVRGNDVAPFTWSVRAFVPGNPREARVHFAPDGRIIGFERKLADADPRPTVSADSGQRLAELALNAWVDNRANRWKLITASYETKKTSARVDRTYTFERVDRRIGGAPIRAEVEIAGDTPARVRPYVEIPESFRRRYAEMRSWNDLLALLASLGILGVAIIGIVALTRFSRERRVRWREPMAVGLAIGVLAFAAGINELSGSWFSYDSAMSAATFQVMQFLLAVLFGVSTVLLVGFTLAAAEAATRNAFPRHLDWWKLWQFRGTREVASQVGGGYAVAAIAFAYVAIFYLVTRTLFGWWVPSELLDDPNQIASPMPWISGIAVSVNAGVWEESLFRALPLSLLSLWIGQRSGRRWLMAAGVVASALIFGFAHSNYESWPPYSRGVEIFVDACFWAVLFINFGLLVTVVAHFVYDLVLFGLFAASGHAAEYRVTAAIILLALLTPALVVLWRWVRQRGFVPAPEEARFGAWTPAAAEETAAPIAPRQAGVFTTRARRLALAGAVVGVIFAVARPPKPTLGPPFTADRGRVVQTADSMLLARRGNPAGWTRLTGIGRDTLEAWPRFLREHKLVGEAQRFASTYVPPTWWTVRYVHTKGTAAQRTEEWRVRVWPDGRPLDTRHLVPDSARRDSADSSALRRIALASLSRQGMDTSTLQESELKETARPARRDATVTYTDTAIKLPDGAAARTWVQVAGDDPLVARRGVDLPEAFLRADRQRQTDRMMVAGVCILLLLGLIVTGAIVVKRRRPILVTDGMLARRDTYILLGTLVVFATLSSLNSLPSKLFKYDTAQPWGSFIGTTALGVVVSIPAILILFGLWLALSAMRRRVGIPMLAGEPSRSASDDMLIAGLGLGGVIFAMSQLSILVPRGGVPDTPTTVLSEAFPLLAGVTDIPMIVLMTISTFGIPLLVVAGLTRRWSLRALMAAAIAALLSGAIWSLGPASDVEPGRVAMLIARVAVVSVAVAVWGSLAAWSWLVAALAYLALGNLRIAAYGVAWQERGAAELTMLGAAALIVLIARRAARESPSPMKV
ncbi:MAG TPA: type II CAAX endopeptidase family protein [Gemmatimonadaceae bacterium]|nr:type II CAAX endopeptidase family protein [Gemmatimonadaceae bacterium]